MNKAWLAAIISLFSYMTLLANTARDTTYTESTFVLHTSKGDITGTLTIPGCRSNNMAVALIIAGSGPTDRNGNNPMMKNESLRLLAHGLAMHNIASLRIDKRGLGESRAAFTG